MPELTDRTIAALRVDKRTEIADQGYNTHPRRLRRGLMLLVSPTGKRTWIIKKAYDGKRVSIISMVNPTSELSVPKYHQRHYHFPKPESFLPKLGKSSVRDDIQNVLRPQYQTFTRVGEAAGLPWVELNLRKRQWIVPAERSKTGQPHLIMVSKQSVALLRSLKNDSDYVFPKPVRLDKPLDADDVVKGINKARASLKVHKDFSSHSLRHTRRTWLSANGCTSEVAERLLNHSMADTNDMSKRYDHHQYETEKKLWTQKWCDYISK